MFLCGKVVFVLEGEGGGRIKIKAYLNWSFGSTELGKCFASEPENGYIFFDANSTTHPKCENIQIQYNLQLKAKSALSLSFPQKSGMHCTLVHIKNLHQTGPELAFVTWMNSILMVI